MLADLEAYRASKQQNNQGMINPSSGGIQADLESYRASKQQSNTQPQQNTPEENPNNGLQRLFVNTIGRPGVRGAQAITGGLVQKFGNEQQKENYFNEIKKPVKLPLNLGTVAPQKELGQGGGKQIAVEAGKSALDIATFGAGGAITKAFKGATTKALPQLAKSKFGGKVIETGTNIAEGLAYNTGFNVLNDEKATKNAGIVGVASAILPPVVGGAINRIQKATPSGKIIKAREEISKLLNKNKSLVKKTQELKDRGFDAVEALTDPEVFNGLKVENGKIVVDDAMMAVDDKIDTAFTAKKKILPEIDRIIPPVDKQEIRKRALLDIVGQNSLADEQAIIKSIDEQLAPYPEKMNISQIDDFRAQMRKSSRDAKGLMKRDSEYSALEDAARNIIFDKTSNLPQDLVFGAADEVKELNIYMSKLLTLRKFLDKTLRGESAPGVSGLSKLSSKILGGIVGSKGGPLGSLLTSQAGGFIHDILTNNQLGSGMKLSLIKGLTDDPAVIRNAEELLSKLKNANPLSRKQLTAGAIRVPQKDTSFVKAVPAEKNPVTQNPKTGKFETTYNSNVAVPKKPQPIYKPDEKIPTIKKTINDLTKKKVSKQAGFSLPKTLIGGSALGGGAFTVKNLSDRIKEKDKQKEEKTPIKLLEVIKERSDGNKLYRTQDGLEVGDIHKDLQNQINKAYKNHPEIKKGILEAIIMKESSGGYEKSQYNKNIGEYAWLGGLTQIAKKELIRNNYEPDFDTIEGVINAIAKFWSIKQKDMTPYEVYKNEYSSGKLSEEHLQKFKKFVDFYKDYKGS